ncbi:MAG: PAS domain S-box protein [Candidatus Bathyarchaeota archaeon]|jgi:PAS domain S-box-containing protein
MGRQVSKQKRRLAEEDAEKVREDYVQKMRDNYPLIIRTLMHDLIFSVDKDGNLVFLNDAAVEFLGMPSEEIIGTHFVDYLYPEDVKKTQAALQEIIKSKGQVKGLIIRVKSPRGARKVALNAVAIFDEEGNHVGIQATGKDLTDLLRTEEELEQSRSHFRRLFEVLVDPVVIVDMNGKILELSQSAEEILEFPREDLVGKQFMENDVVTDKSKAMMMKTLEKLKKGEYAPPHTIEVVTKDGKKLLYESTPTKLMYKGEPAILGIFRSITEQKKAEEKLQASEMRFKYFLENAPEAIWVQDLVGTFLDGNKLAEELTGYKKEELIGKSMLEMNLVPSEYIPIAMEAFKANKPGEISGPNELELIRKDGSLVSVEASTIPVERDGKIEIIGIARDITDRKNAEEALKESEKRSRELSDLLPEVVFETDATGRLTFVNQIAFDQFGYSQEDFDKGLNAAQMLIPEDRDRAMEEIDRVLSGADVDFTEYTALRKDGSTFPIMIHSTPIIRGNMPVGLRGIIVDITERKKMENVLKESEEKYRTVFEGATDGIAALDPKTMKVIFTNPKMTEITGYPLDELLNATIIDFVPKDELSLVIQQFQNHVGGKRDLTRYIPVVRKDKTKIYCDVRSKFLNIGNQQYLMAFVRDVTEQKKAEEALKESEKRFRELSELLPEIVFETDATGELTFVNKATLDSTGYSQEDFDKGLNALQLVVAEDRDNIKKSIGELLSGKKIGTSEYTALRKDGSTFPIIIHSNSITRENRVVGMRGLIVDITDRKRAEEALKESEERFRSTLDNMMEGCQIVDYNWRYLYVNDAGARHAHLAKKDLLGKTIMETQPGIEKTELFAVLRRCMNERVPAHMEYEFLYPNGERNWFELSIEPMPDGIFVISIDINDRKRAEKELIRLSNAVRMSNDSIVISDLDGTILDVNEASLKMHGTDDKSDLIGTNAFGLVAPEDQEKALAGMKEVLEKGYVQSREYQIVTNDGSKIPVEMSTAIMKDANGKPIGFVSVTRNITERKKAEEALKESEKKYREMINGMNDVALVLDFDTNIIDANQTAVDVLGYSMEELLSMKVHQFDASLTAKEIKGLAEKMKTNGLVVLETTHTTKDGRTFPVEVSASPVTYQGKPALLSIERDITERKKAEEALRKSEEAARRLLEFQNKIIDTATVWVNLIDPKGNVILWNRAAELVSGYSRKEIIGNNKIWELLYPDPDYRTKIFSVGKEITEKGKRIEDFYSTIRCKDGSVKTISWYATNIRDEKGEPAGSISIGVDVTEREKAQQAINNALALLRQSNRELESYTYVVSHDLKAPLRTIRSFGTFLLEDYKDKLDETGKDYLHRMINASSHLNTMIEDLLVLSRVGRKFTELEKVDLNELLKEIISDLEATIKERKAKVIVDKLPVLSAQKVWNRQLFMNLISNALKFNESKTPKIEVLYEEKQNDHLFKVRDNGIGIEKKYLERIFNLFERAPTDKKYDGTGAGLAICKKIVEQLGGKIWVKSTLGKGSTFIFTIPKELKQTEET